jgi:flagellar protein FliO/FliZ
MFDMFGLEMPLAVKFFVAFAVVLVLIGLTAWLVRRFGANRLGATARGRQPRLAVIDAASVDGRRRLVLIRRDNIEHLLMIGGPTDLVVEPNIVRVVGTREVAREQPRMVSEVPPRPAPPPESSWPLQPTGEPVPITPINAPRPYRTSATEEPWLPPEPGARARPAAELSGLDGELSARLNPPELRAEPRVTTAPPSEPPQSARTEHNLAEMAQQLEAALRRTPVGEARPPVTDALAAAGKANEPARAAKPRVEPKLEPKPEPKAETKPEAKPEPKGEPKLEPKLEPAARPGKSLYDNLEQEMASLLGRPPGKP